MIAEVSTQRLRELAEGHEAYADQDAAQVAACIRAVIAAREWCRKWEAHEGVMPHELAAIVGAGGRT